MFWEISSMEIRRERGSLKIGSESLVRTHIYTHILSSFFSVLRLYLLMSKTGVCRVSSFSTFLHTIRFIHLQRAAAKTLTSKCSGSGSLTPECTLALTASSARSRWCWSERKESWEDIPQAILLPGRSYAAASHRKLVPAFPGSCQEPLEPVARSHACRGQSRAGGRRTRPWLLRLRWSPCKKRVRSKRNHTELPEWVRMSRVQNRIDLPHLHAELWLKRFSCWQSYVTHILSHTSYLQPEYLWPASAG